MTMQRKELETIAATLKAVKPPFMGQTREEGEAAKAQWERTVAAFASELHTVCGFDNNGNRRFKRDRFLRACEASQ